MHILLKQCAKISMSTPVVKQLNAHHTTMFSNSDEKVVNLLGQQCAVRLLKISYCKCICPGLPFNIIIIH
jgi:hypothetical protein